MLVNCPECQREVSSSATACPGCGHPLAATRAGVPHQSSLAGSFMLGSLGTVVRLVGFLALLLSIIGFVLHGDSAPLFLILGIALIVGGSYAKFVSRHSMRLTK